MAQLDNHSTNNQEIIIPQSMPQLGQLEQNFKEFLLEYNKITNNHNSLYSFQKFLESVSDDLSSDQITANYKSSLNEGGSFCFKDKESGYEIELCTANGNKNNTYMRDPDGEEVLFLSNFDPANGRNTAKSLSKVKGKRISNIDEKGIEVKFRSESDRMRQSADSKKKNEISDESEKVLSRVFKSINIFKPKAKEVDENIDLQKKKYETKKVFSTVYTEELFGEFNQIIAKINASLNN